MKLKWLHIARVCAGCFGVALLLAGGAAADPAREAGERLFSIKVFPLLENKCLSCHGEEEQESDLALYSLEGMLLWRRIRERRAGTGQSRRKPDV